MRPMTDEEAVIYNEGERLIPGVTHSIDELVRHQSSYDFFTRTIEEDMRFLGHWRKEPVTIVDLGFGVGHGCKVLSRIPGSRVVGVDNFSGCRDYAKKHYDADNIEWVIEDIPTFLKKMPKFDYVVSRGVIEHVPNGIHVTAQANWGRRLIIDVPYDEPAGINPHHLVSFVTEKDFENYPSEREILYEENSGEIYLSPVRRPIPNMIMCVATKGNLPKVADYFTFPIPAWDPAPGVRALAEAMRKMVAENAAKIVEEGAAQAPASNSLYKRVRRRLTEKFKHRGLPD
jgi:hypothetical protein